MNTASINEELLTRLREFIEMEARSGSMEPALITPEYVYRMWGGAVELRDIEEVMKRVVD
jgi:7-keto-8-aminopelargonate synthetase-like enzyme